MVRRRVSLTGMSIGSSNIANNNDNNRKQRRRKSAAAADNVLAGTAGLDNWKTWAGRQHGGDEFEFLDLFRGMKRTITHKFLTGPPPPGTTCPVCFCEPDEWHVTSSCFHAVCIDCFKAYASNQVKDVQQSGPLKCPVCPQVLRRSDAIAALGGDRELIRQWDLKIRNQLLRALPAFRSCPHCSNTNNTTTATATSFETNNHTTNSAAEITDYGSDDDSSTNDSSNNNGNGGGGFVTPECLGPHYQERRDIATKILYALPLVTIALFLFWIFLVVAIAKTPSSSAMIDLLFMLLPLYSIVRAGRVAHGWVAQAARKAHFKPITVECPCCDKAFILPAESKELHDEETSRWMNAHTRPCPSCSVPIHKDGGCNHMRCGHCHANFCWACMRLRTDCAAYACRNGAQYGNALPVPGVNGNGNNGNGRAPILGADSILSIIDYILDRPRPTLDWKVDGLLLGYAVLIRHFGPLQQFVEYIMAFISTLFTSGIVTTGVALYVSKLTCERLRLEMANRAAIRAAQQELQQQQPLPPPQIQRRRNNNHNILFNDNHNATASELLLGIDARNGRQRQRNVNIMTEREMIAEATRRSMVER